MTISWNTKKTKLNPAPIIEKLEEARKISDDGKVKFEGGRLRIFGTLIFSMLSFPDCISEIDARRILFEAIFKAGSKDVITSKKLLAELNKLEQKFNALPIQRYALATSISLSLLLKLHNIRQQNSLIIFENSLPKIFRQESSELLNKATASLFADLPRDYVAVRVHVSSKTIYDAANKASEKIDFVRGIWNWTINRHIRFRYSSSVKPQPINQIILGPIHTLHKANGVLATTDEWWFEPSYVGAIRPYKPPQEFFDSLYSSLNGIRKKLKIHKYPNDIQNAFIRYTRALDERNYTTAFLKLWSILEFLTDTIGSRYDVTVRRTAFLYKEREFHYQVLQHLRLRRNLTVHFDKDTSEMKESLFNLKNYVESLISFHINNQYGFESIQEAAEFLSLPYEGNNLNHKIELLKYAKKFFGCQ